MACIVLNPVPLNVQNRGRHIHAAITYIPGKQSAGKSMKSSVKKFTSLLSKASILGACVVQFPAYGAAKPFVLEEATIKSIHTAFENKTLTCSALVQSYLARIEA